MYEFGAERAVTTKPPISGIGSIMRRPDIMYWHGVASRITNGTKILRCLQHFLHVEDIRATEHPDQTLG